LFHADKYGRPALALDLMRNIEFPIVDSVVPGLINKRVIATEGFEQDEKTEI
jgi:CRISPR/Cas system-associated endonuclease Cas1